MGAESRLLRLWRLIYHETVTLRMLVGFAVIFGAILLSQWDGKRAGA